MEVDSDAESNSVLISDQPVKETPKQNAATEYAVQSASRNRRATMLAMDVQAPMDVEQQEEELAKEATESKTPTVDV